MKKTAFFIAIFMAVLTQSNYAVSNNSKFNSSVEKTDTIKPKEVVKSTMLSIKETANAMLDGKFITKVEFQTILEYEKKLVQERKELSAKKSTLDEVEFKAGMKKSTDDFNNSLKSLLGSERFLQWRNIRSNK
jgi:hypothetical protein